MNRSGYLHFGTGRSSTAICLGPWNTTAFIVAGRSDMMLGVDCLTRRNPNGNGEVRLAVETAAQEMLAD